jgi:uncharacterized membrane protein
LSIETGGTRARWQLLDLLRGIAILAMVVFHFAWDLYYFGYSPVDVTQVLGWVVFQKSILTSFLLLVGVGLVLGHGQGIRWRAFWRRWAFLVVAALLTTAGTYWMFPDYFVFFGVLHAIALFSLMALPFLRLRWWITALAGVVVIAANFAWNDVMFEDRWLAWIGFWPTSPPTSDVVPVFPWFGVVLLGVALMRLIMASPLVTGISAWRSNVPLAKGIAWLGRWSLPFYLLHQPVIIGVLYGIMMIQTPVLAPPVVGDVAGFTASCNASCGANGWGAAQCEAYCSCALDQIQVGNLWEKLSDPKAPEVAQLRDLCTAMHLPK